jgi:hypothetical protein
MEIEKMTGTDSLPVFTVGTFEIVSGNTDYDEYWDSDTHS